MSSRKYGTKFAHSNDTIVLDFWIPIEFMDLQQEASDHDLKILDLVRCQTVGKDIRKKSRTPQEIIMPEEQKSSQDKSSCRRDWIWSQEGWKYTWRWLEYVQASGN